MAIRQVPLQIRTETGAQGSATGRYTVYPTSVRLVAALLWLAGGFGLGFLLFPVPIVHLISTWACPLAGILGAVNAVKTHAKISYVEGRCPACNGKLLMAGGRAVFPVRDSCEHCGRPILIEPGKK